ncbi:retrovirus-related pol polyprotein from transposon TNT 1-94 [Tanacetum coccineum]
MRSLQKNQTWELTNLPEGKKAIGCKWVYAKKEGFPGQDDVRYKARLVAKGYAQKEGIDYNEVFSPVVKHSSIRILLALVAQLDLKLVQMYVKTAFLHGDWKRIFKKRNKKKAKKQTNPSTEWKGQSQKSANTKEIEGWDLLEDCLTQQAHLVFALTKEAQAASPRDEDFGYK